MATIPQNLAFEQANQEVIKVVNACISQLNVPMYEMEVILRNAHSEVLRQAQEELNRSQEEYQAAIRAEQEAAMKAQQEATEVEITEE